MAPFGRPLGVGAPPATAGSAGVLGPPLLLPNFNANPSPLTTSFYIAFFKPFENDVYVNNFFHQSM